jgi:hypothetical protein
MVETIFEATGGYLRSEKATECIPLLEGDVEHDHSFGITLPDMFIQSNLKAITQGNLYLLIQGARQTRKEVLLTSTSELTIIDSPIPAFDHQDASQRRRTQSRTLANDGTTRKRSRRRTAAVMRVSAIDSQIAHTAEEIDSIIFNKSGINFVTQYHACSFGQLKWRRSHYGVVDVMLNKTMAELENDSATIVSMALDQVKADLGIQSAADLADHVMVCVPPGTGDWAANAGVNYWRSQFNNDWCTSLTANMHELGHK